MHSIQPHGIDPIIPSYHLLPKGERTPIHTPWQIDWKEPLQKCYLTPEDKTKGTIKQWRMDQSSYRALYLFMRNVKILISNLIINSTKFTLISSSPSLFVLSISGRLLDNPNVAPALSEKSSFKHKTCALTLDWVWDLIQDLCTN